ncbi:hypothetical protein [Massilia rubra]|uniref:DUF4136 domain-containing protein n=1 Tax=Massilia rubra TaxID=2607910 RepID=A0ABX0LQ48_9BURK|nr:hypothetical protein [Massilia rubra]NHZ34027.1 hypothetical protein [Massilia rubra]
MKMLHRLFCVVFALALSACASTEVPKAELAVPGFVLSGSSVYIYSFLDVRDSTFGQKLLAEFDAQFAAALKGAAVTSTVLRFRDSEHGGYFAPASGNVANQVMQTVTMNLANERKSGALQRLTIEPANVIITQGVRHNYDIKWSLSDASTGSLIWSTTTTGTHLNWGAIDENPRERAKSIVDEIIRQMQVSKLI